MNFTHQNLTFHFEAAGAGLPLLLIHGYPLGCQMWLPQINGLRHACRVIAPDLRGFGASQASSGPVAMDTFADDCAALLDHLEIEQAALCGLSMGGYIAFAFWRKYPQRVSRLILAATRALPDSAETAENRLKAAALAEKEGAEAIARAMLPKMLSPITQAEHPERTAQVKAIMLEASVAGIVGALLGMRQRPDSTPTLPTIGVPALIIRGDDDPFAPLEEAEAMSKAMPQARLARIAQAAHLPNLEQPEIFNRLLGEFMAQ
jgi:pimeloyl-ACP methyl ester carboxylesterase